MLPEVSSNSDLDDLMRRIRAEVEGSSAGGGPVARSPDVPAAAPPQPQPEPKPEPELLAEPQEQHETVVHTVDDFLLFDDEAFLDNAYGIILGRTLDNNGRERFLPLLRSGRLSKIECLARLRLSPEGRRRRVPIKGRLALRGMARAAFNVPLLGYLFAWTNYLIKLPVLARTLETTQADLRVARQALTGQVKAMEQQLDATVSRSSAQLTADLWDGLNKKVDKEPYWDFTSSAISRDEVAALLATKPEIRDLTDLLRSKLDVAEFQELWEQKKLDVSDLRKLLEAKADCSELEKLLHDYVCRADLERALAGKIDREQYQEETARTSVNLWAAIDTKLGVDVFDAREAELLRVLSRKGDEAEKDAAEEDAAEEDAESSGAAAETEAGAARQEKRAAELSAGIYWQALNSKVDKTWIYAQQASVREGLDAIATSQHRLDREQRQLKTTLVDQHRRVDLLLQELRKRMPAPLSPAQMSEVSAVDDHWLESHYVNFEDIFRGTREDIKSRAEVYLPFIRAANAGSQERPVIDIGCGRGELLELLMDHGLHGEGVDQNHHLVQRCLDAGLNATKADALDFLAQLPPNSVGAVTGLHIIEHIPFERLVRLLDESLRVLCPGGVAVFETPNPENLVVGACNFWYDPTHLHPLPPNLSRFMLEARGFVSVDTERLAGNRIIDALSEVPGSQQGSEDMNRIIGYVNKYLAAEPDYAVIGYKA